MDMHMLEAAGQALLILMDPARLMFLMIGVVLGLVLGILPGIGGLAGTALLLPFTFNMDPYSAFALLLGLAATTSTGDPIPAILFGVPGGAGSAATVLDGLPMAKRGEAGRALSAAYMSSLLGGVFGALLMAVALPIMRPFILLMQSPELLALAVFGISLVATLSGNAPLKGLTAGAFGVMLAMIGSDPQTGTMRWTLGTLYLWDGMPLVPVVLGVFALPELCDLLISRTTITGKLADNVTAGMWQGAKDCFRHWWLVLRCSWIGTVFGAIPGVGGSVIDWLAYAHASRTEKGALKTFGQGDVRGVIAAESSNNAKEAGHLIPTIAFGVPAGASMALLLGAFLVHGLDPGPEMLTKHLNVTYSMVWSLALANILGAGLCFLFSRQFAILATLRYTLILPSVLGIIYIGAFEGSRSWGDLYALLFFGVLGWTMKQLKWPRPPLILGFVLGATIERYLFISIQLYGVTWFARPIVALVFTVAIYGMVSTLYRDARARGGLTGMLSRMGAPSFAPGDWAYVAAIAACGIMLFEASAWQFNAKIVPVIVGWLAVAFAVMGLAGSVFLRRVPAVAPAPGEAHTGPQAIHMDLESDTGHLPLRTILIRASIFFGWMIGFMASMATIGLIPTVPLFVVMFMRIEGYEPWRIVIPQAACLTLFIYVLFDRLLLIPWPPTLVGMLLPAMKFMPSV